MTNGELGEEEGVHFKGARNFGFCRHTCRRLTDDADNGRTRNYGNGTTPTMNDDLELNR